MVKAKPLVWEDYTESMGKRQCSRSVTPLGVYYIKEQFLPETCYALYPVTGLNTRHATLEAAKAAAQAHADALVADMAQPVTQQEAARVLLEAIDAFMDGDKLTEAQSELQKSAVCAGCFAAAAYDAHIPKSGGEYHTLTRSFLLALIDPTHEDLDYLRADPSSGMVAREANAALRAIAEPPQSGEGE